ncbi:MAG: NACHT domain-containing protein [Gammaproteobacteria bacterium]|nr:MAG: NACHT domain-containing protein [Gammaproteobacteria bacterium]
MPKEQIPTPPGVGIHNSRAQGSMVAANINNSQGVIQINGCEADSILAMSSTTTSFTSTAARLRMLTHSPEVNINQVSTSGGIHVDQQVNYNFTVPFSPRDLVGQTMNSFLSPELVDSSALLVRLKHCYQSQKYLPPAYDNDQKHDVTQFFVQLQIIESALQKNKEKQQLAEESITFLQRYEKLYSEKKTIGVKDIFQAQAPLTKTPQRVCIFGGAGIGKSTLCRYYAVSQHLWEDKFDWVFWVPLRNLMDKNRYPENTSYTLTDIAATCFGYQGLNKTDRAYLEQVVERQKDRILWLLDGYDEVSPLSEKIPYFKLLLEEVVFTQPWVVITSRPHAVPPFQADMQLEAIGFADGHIEQYVHRFFSTNDNIDTINLLTFLRSNPGLWGISHIPINLELLCNLWHYHQERQQPFLLLSFTDLYSQIVEYLLRCSLNKQGKESDHWAKEMVYTSYFLPIKFLQYAAFLGQEHGQLILTGGQNGLFQDSLKHCNLTILEAEQAISGVLQMGLLKSITHSKVAVQNDYYFSHLTFQEFFTAMHIAYCLETSKEVIPGQSLKTFIATRKYESRYEMVLPFVGGLLKDKPKALKYFFDMLLAEPREAVGSYELQMFIRILEEAGASEAFPYTEKILRYAVTWIKMGLCEWKGESLFRTLSNSPNVRQMILSVWTQELQHSHEWSIKIDAIKSLKKVAFLDPKVVISALLQAFQDKDFRVSFKAISHLNEIAEELLEKVALLDPKVVISALLQAFQDKWAPIRGCAVELLGKVASADPRAVIPALLQALQDKCASIKSRAAKSLGKVALIDPETIILVLIQAIQDEDSYVRGYAVESLGKVALVYPEKIIPVLLRAFQDKNKTVRSNSIQLLGEVISVNPEIIIPILIQALQDEDKFIRMSAVNLLEGLASIDSRVVPALLQAFQDDNDWLARQFVAVSLAKNASVDPKTIILVLIQAIQDNDSCVMGRVTKLLEKATMTDFEATVPVLLRMLRDNDPYVRGGVAKLLGKFVSVDPIAVIPALLQVIQDNDAYVRGNAIISLGKIAIADAKAIIPALLRAFQDNNLYVKKNAVKSLGKIVIADPEVILPTLFQAFQSNILQDKSTLINLAARKALDKIVVTDVNIVISYIKQKTPKYTLVDYVHGIFKNEPHKLLHYCALEVLEPIELLSLLKDYMQHPLSDYRYLNRVAEKICYHNIVTYFYNDKLYCVSKYHKKTQSIKIPPTLAKKIIIAINQTRKSYYSSSYKLEPLLPIPPSGHYRNNYPYLFFNPDTNSTEDQREIEENQVRFGSGWNFVS